MSRLLFLTLLLAATGSAWAQDAKHDVVLRTDGTEVPGRVLTITPLELRCLASTGTDTLRLATNNVFMVRYANGTREVLHPTTPAPAVGPPDAQRRSLAQQDAARGYNNPGPFWGSLGATLYGGPLLGVVAPAIIASQPVSAANLHTPHPELLADPAYGTAYRQAAKHRKANRAWAGYGVGAGAWVVLVGVFLANLSYH